MFDPLRRYHAGQKKTPFNIRRSWFAPSKSPETLCPEAGLVVEAAGTAPASAMPITRTVYCHSQQADVIYIGGFSGELKAHLIK